MLFLFPLLFLPRRGLHTGPQAADIVTIRKVKMLIKFKKEEVQEQKEQKGRIKRNNQF